MKRGLAALAVMALILTTSVGARAVFVIRYTITYDPNGGTGSAYSLTPAGGTNHMVWTPTRAILSYSREDYAFTSWNTAADGSGKQYAVGDDYYVNENITFYAQWVRTSPELFTHTAYIYGCEDGTFRPDEALTRAQAAAILARTLGSYDPEAVYEASFTDVAADAWYFGYVACLTESGMISGYGDGTFRPNEAVTRQEMAVLLAKTADNTAAARFLPFTDADKIGSWAQIPAYICQQRGWMIGDDTGAFRPLDSMTRAEAVSILNQVLERGTLAGESLAAAEAYTGFPDVAANAWYYSDVLEAAIGHTYYLNDAGDEVWVG